MGIEYEYKYAPEEDPESYRGLALEGICGSNTETVEEAEQWVADQLAAGNKWAWCAPRVKAEINIGGATFRAVITAECTSARSEADFCNTQLDGACFEARAALLKKLLAAAERGAAATRAIVLLYQVDE